MLADTISLPDDTYRRVLTSNDLARIDGYRGGATDLHELLPAVLPLTVAHWYETTITAQHGTVMTLGYLAEPHADGIAVSFTAAGNGKMLMLIGPAVVTATGMRQPAGLPDEHWRELQSAAGIVIRALLLRL